MLLIRLILIIEVFGWRQYNSQSFDSLGFAIDNQNCPKLHIFMAGLHPYKCVSYALICKGVTEVQVKTGQDGTQHQCHPKFQPWGAGTPTLDGYMVHCGFNVGVSLVIEQLPDDSYKYYCKYFANNSHNKCLITAYQKGLFRCQMCKLPFFGNGFGCDQVLWRYDRRFIVVCKKITINFIKLK
ncbi:unnamed protein product [Paramecium primaurelia]|uniref:S-protein homolog n=1 Tax=Paramecium primaurelia TaxID=5886 RepID=A0A8S1P1Y1_PARPR|nr:unnamed protein product [Paramecium primaurelia]